MTTVNQPYRYQYETVAASASSQVLGGTGAIGDYLHRIIVTITTSGSNGVVSLVDGSTTIALCTNGIALGTYSFEINAVSQTTGWKVTTGSAATAVGVGVFSA